MKRIIIVEDNLADAELVKISANELGHPIQIQHATGNEDFHKLFFDEDLSDVVLVMLDLNMPRVNGIEILQKIRSTPKNNFIPVVIFTTSANKNDIFACYDSGANAYVCKPIDYDTFNLNIRAIIEFWALNNLLPQA
jgi:two-component system, response regulator